MLTELKNAVEGRTVPYHIGVQMQDTIRMTLENTIMRAGKEVDTAMTTNIVETLPWIDCGEVFKKLEERGRTEGRAEGRTEGRIEGRAEGRTEGRIEIAGRLLRMNMPLDQIAAATGLTPKEIENLRNIN